MVAVTTITIVSCQKDKQTGKENGRSILSENEKTDNMDEYLLSFKDKLLNATKDGETIGVEQALLDMGNLLNFDFGDANNATNIFLFDTLYAQLPLTNGMVYLSDLATTYNNAFTQILNSYRALDLPDKSVYAISCNLDETGDNNNTEKVCFIVKYRGFARNDIFGTFNGHDTLSWHPTYWGGSCDDPTIEYGGAADMEIWLNHSQPEFNCINGGRFYFTEYGCWGKKGYDTYDSVANRYKIFTEYTYQIDTVCISHEDMEYYYSNILDYFNQEKPSGHIMDQAHVLCTVISIPPDNPDHHPGDCWFWWVSIYHGKGNCTDIEPIH